MMLDEAAILYASRDWPVAPLHSVRAGVCSCPAGAACDRSPGKHPRTEHGLDDATTDPKIIKSWWGRWKDANIAVRCDRLFILDVDPRHGGDRYLAELEQQHGALPQTMRVHTGGGGWHHYFTAPAGRWRKTIAPGLDIQAGRGKYVLAPPSNHLSGRIYQLDVDAGIVPAPAWLVAAATRPPEDTAAKSGAPVAFDGQMEKRVRAYLGRCPPAVSGQGGHTHTLMVAQHVVRGFSLDDDVAYSLLCEWNRTCDPPWSERDLRRKIQEARKKGSRVEWGAHLRDDRPAPKSSTFRETPPHRDEDAPPPTRARLSLVEREPGSDDEGPSQAKPVTAKEPEQRSYGLTMADLLSTSEEEDEDDTLDWRVRGFAPDGVPSIIAGEPKSKKTMIALHQAICVAAGIPLWLGEAEFRIRQGRVLVLALEDHIKTTRRRIRRMAWGLGVDPRSLDNLRVEPNVIPFHFDRVDDRNRMRRTLDTWKADWIIADSLTKTHNADENSVKEMAPVMEAWESLCREYKSAVSAIHHLNKPPQSGDKRRIGNRMRGTTSLFAFIRHVVGVSIKEKDLLELDVDGNLAFHPESFQIEVRDGVDPHGKSITTLHYVGMSKNADADALSDSVLTSLLEGPLTSADVAKAIKKQKALVLVTLRRLMEARRVRVEDRKWVLVR